ncbi:hypothetical protein [Winogradskyella flava]|uniref:DUF4251 domain-containing protein n=1 Tax=Winogradskyella flava TaxID=1884876 RepID=A0A842IP88_9FLAO|nr:hypothetical protein [Winogradskyella flava]MBC2845042.1 hypothetical protein [Winogradskyella flava]
MMKHFSVIALLFSLVATSFSGAQTKTTQKEKFETQYNATKTLVKSKSYTYIGEVVFNDEKRELLQAETNYIDINNSDVLSIIQALGQKQPVEVNGSIDNYSVNFDDGKQVIVITFVSNANEFLIEIKPTGKAFLTMNASGLLIKQAGFIKPL